MRIKSVKLDVCDFDTKIQLDVYDFDAKIKLDIFDFDGKINMIQSSWSNYLCMILMEKLN